MADSKFGRVAYDMCKFQEALTMACHLLQVESFYEDQEKAPRQFFRGKDIFFSAHTGYGKSLVFQAIPILADVLVGKVIGTSVVVVISPLTSLMKDQVKIANERFGISAAAIYSGQDDEILANVENGVYSIVYVSPEAFLATTRWRSLAASNTFKDNCVAIVIDEGHCLVQWGKSTSSKHSPFRIWYSNLVELKSLLPSTRYAIFTATATKITKRAIFDMLDLSPHNTFCIEKPPTRSNTCYHFNYVDRDISLEAVFKVLIDEIKAKRQEAKRTLIFCQTRKQCSMIYRMFNIVLGEELYAAESHDVRMRLVEMFHAGTPEPVKTHIVNEMGRFGSHLRFIIATVAFGMGIDCKDVYRSIHFGPPKTVELLVQECGRIGRDGKQCICYVLYNGFLTSHCNGQMKELIHSTCCRREYVLNLFSTSNLESGEKSCHCCDNCALVCQCPNPLEPMQFGKKFEEPNQDSAVRTRSVSDNLRHILYQKLVNYRKTLLPKNAEEFMPVGSPNVLFEFGYYQIEQIMKNCYRLFTLEDILFHIELWRHVHANNVFKALSETFNDMSEAGTTLLLSEEEFQDMEIVTEDWEDIRDDSSLGGLLMDSSLYSKLDTSVENSLTECTTVGDLNISGIFQAMADAVEMDTTHTSNG